MSSLALSRYSDFTSFEAPTLTFLRLPEKSSDRPGLTSGLGVEEVGVGEGERRSCREGRRGLLVSIVAPPCGWFGEVRPEAMPSSRSANESVSTAREVRSLSLDGPRFRKAEEHTSFLQSLYAT